MLDVLGDNIGIEALVIGSIAAIIPVPVLVLVFLWLDRYEPEPIGLLVFCFAWGTFVATGLALVVNPSGLPLLRRSGCRRSSSPWRWPRSSRRSARRPPRCCCCGDADVCSPASPTASSTAVCPPPGSPCWRTSSTSAGTATGRVWRSTARPPGLQALLGLFIVRILISGFAHPLFTAAAGVGIGVAARSVLASGAMVGAAAGLLVAMALHATWNTMATLTQPRSELLFMLYGYVAMMVPIFVTAVALALWLRSWEGRLTQRVLPAYVRAGWLAPPEVAALRSLGSQHAARRWAARVAGPAGVRAMRAFQFAAMRLALLRDRIDRGLDSTPEEMSRSAAEEQELLAEMAAHRQVFVGRDPQVPPARWDGQAYDIVFPDGSARRIPAPVEPVVPVPVLLPPHR